MIRQAHFRGRNRILVTGGAGFLGSNLCKALVEQQSPRLEVLCVDNFYTGSRRNLQSLTHYSNFEFLRHDITFPLYLEVDEIYNLACPASPPYYQNDPVQTVKTNVMGTINMLGLAKRTQAKILQASTSEIYGDPQEHPQTEEYWGNVNAIGPRGCYDEGKRCAETLFFDYHRQHNVYIKVARIFNTYGPGMDMNDGRVVSNFIVQALRGQDLTVYGDGSQTRSFCYVDDMVRGLIKFMGSGNFPGPLNLGNPQEVTMLELAETILRLTASDSNIIHQELPSDDPTRRMPDISLAKKEIHWEPEVSLEEGLGRTIEYFKEQIQVFGLI